jgi:hypothetical protein
MHVVGLAYTGRCLRLSRRLLSAMAGVASIFQVEKGCEVWARSCGGEAGQWGRPSWGENTKEHAKIMVGDVGFKLGLPN